MKKVLIGMPNMGSIPTKTAVCLFNLKDRMQGTRVALPECSLIYQIRNDICREALADGFDEVLFIDSDLIFPDDAYEKLEALDADIASGIYYGRAGDHRPVVYQKVATKWIDKKGVVQSAVAENFKTIPDGTFEIAACGMGMCLIKRKVLEVLFKEYAEEPFEPFDGLGEDLAFCFRAKKHGFNIKANSYIPLGHIGTQVFTKGDYKA